MSKGRSPTMRHVSRTHRVAIGWSLERINMDPRIQIKYVDTKNHLADILTRGSFTRHEWNHLVHLLNIFVFVDVFLQPFLSFKSNANRTFAMSKRRREASAEESCSLMAKPKPRSTNLVMAKQRSISSVPPDMSSYFSSRDVSDSESRGGMLRLDQAVFAHAFGNKCRTRV